MNATGKSIRGRFCAIFTFTDDDLVKAESVYYDQLSLLSQLGVITVAAQSGALQNGARQWIYDCEER